MEGREATLVPLFVQLLFLVGFVHFCRTYIYSVPLQIQHILCSHKDLKSKSVIHVCISYTVYISSCIVLLLVYKFSFILLPIYPSFLLHLKEAIARVSRNDVYVLCIQY